MKDKKIKVLVVDDQALIRSIIQRGLQSSEDIEVVAKAGDAYEARDKIIEFQPDVVTLDVEMPKMNGLDFLKKLMPQYPIPVVMVSSLTRDGQSTTLEALEAGAVDFVAKPDGTEGSMQLMIETLADKIRIAATVDVSKYKKKEVPRRSVATPASQLESEIRMIAIGASTGGTTALKDILCELPADIPGTVIVQHMPEGFTKMFAERLNQLCAMEVKEAEDGDEVKKGRVLIAPGDKNMYVEKKGGKFVVKIKIDDKVSGHRPSVDALFHSIAAIGTCENILGVILTGMGKDGAAGITAMRDKGATTIGQDQDSCVVYGMPREAFLLGGIEKQIALEHIAGAMIKVIHTRFVKK